MDVNSFMKPKNWYELGMKDAEVMVLEIMLKLLEKGPPTKSTQVELDKLLEEGRAKFLAKFDSKVAIIQILMGKRPAGESIAAMLKEVRGNPNKAPTAPENVGKDFGGPVENFMADCGTVHITYKELEEWIADQKTPVDKRLGMPITAYAVFDIPPLPGISENKRHMVKVKSDSKEFHIVVPDGTSAEYVAEKLKEVCL